MTKSQYFSLSGYRKFISHAKKTLRVAEIDEHDFGLILRHDVDLSWDMAYQMSRVEKELGVVSTYYVLLTSPYYNPMTREVREQAEQMLEEGFEIGLHFDPEVYDCGDEQCLIERLENEVNMLESLYGFKIQSYSMHNPSKHGKFIKINGLIDAYRADIFNEESYISDSCFSFRGKTPEIMIEKSKQQLVCLLTHPIHYFAQEKISYQIPLERVVINYFYKLHTGLKVNPTYASQFQQYDSLWERLFEEYLNG
ncbi:hypothetical protein [Candidatus Parabeggiatoa sp. HSG14]|uniref:hypothetical protein n=1 Tax=Candidatus Parabeggiatoa sp. HSG14 TaxID=3055593 RepID=UPI0025A898FC|nr:hypothetical protein [Thiotrichales bacterium HSG14]